MKYKYILIFIVFTALGLFFFYSKAQKVNHPSPTPVEQIENEIPDDFLPFYKRFEQDSAFQLAHISFPLKGIKEIDENGGAIEYLYPKDEWIIHKPFDDMGGTFKRSFSVFGDVIVESITTPNGQFSMSRRFAKLGDNWNLIYYQPMGMY